MKKFFILYLFIALFLSTSTAQEQLLIESDLLPGTDTVWVFVPEDYDSTASYPTVYLLHGWSGNYQSWHQLIDTQDYANRYGMIVICPDGFYDSYYLDSPLKTDHQYESHFVTELYPLMLKHYAINRQAVFISGLSMGGHGAFYLFFKHPDLFLGAGSSSGVLDLNHSGSRYKALSTLLGPYDTHKERFNAYSAITLLDKLKGVENKHLIFDCGTKDQFYTCNNNFRKRCDELGIDATYISQPGGHNAPYWKHAIKAHFEFFSEACQ